MDTSLAGSSPPPPTTVQPISRSLALRLYTSHFLSTWNSRLFEFGAVLFLASAYPGTLRPMSVYALVRSGAGIVFAQSVGSWIDNGDRLVVVRTSIVGQRLAVAGSCALFWLLDSDPGLVTRVRDGLFALAVVLACVEKLCSIMNLVSVERDWVVVITEGNENARRCKETTFKSQVDVKLTSLIALNARMRRIDLFCKLAGPLVISSIAITSTLVAIYATLAMNLVSVLAEYFCIERVFKSCPELQRRNGFARTPATANDIEPGHPPMTHSQRQHTTPSLDSWLKRTTDRILPISSLPLYFHHSAFRPSISLAFLYLTVLSFSGQMITYLIAVGYTSLDVGITRTVSTVFELSATWIAPRLMSKIGVVRGGIWSLSWQMAWLAAGVSWFFADFQGRGTNSPTAATGLAVGVALSRVGLWGFDLCAQNIVQDEVDMGHRGTFSTVEAAFQNLFELLAYASTIVFSRPDQFKWPVVISVMAVYAAGGLYASFVRRRRGHLLHVPPCICNKDQGT